MDIYNDVKRIKVDCVPADINGLVTYTVPLSSGGSLKHMKGSRCWGNAQSSTLRGNKTLLYNCRGSYMCTNLDCKKICDFGINQREFTQSESGPLCCSCSTQASFLRCPGRLIIQKHTNTATIFHHGIHTCPVLVQDRPSMSSLETAFRNNPRMTRETFIRQEIQAELEKEGGNFRQAVEKALTLTNVKFIENVKAQVRAETRPEGSHSMEAVLILRDRWVEQDPYLIYATSDGKNGDIPFVMKSSELKVEILLKLDNEGTHRLSEVSVHSDVLHSRCRKWRTYTLSYYDSELRCMVRLAVMDAPKENWEACARFFRTINCMLEHYAKAKDIPYRPFNPYHLKDDEHGGNKIGMTKVFGEDFVSNRTSSCSYHLNISIQKHSSLVNDEDKEDYNSYWRSMKKSITKEAFAKAKRQLEMLISKQPKSSQNKLKSALKFWNDCRFRWSVAYRGQLYAIPSSSLAEAAQASMKAGSQRNVSLVDGCMADIIDSANLKARWINRQRGGSDIGAGPSQRQLDIREEYRQIERALNFTEEMNDLEDSDNATDDDVYLADILHEERSHRPDKKAEVSKFKPLFTSTQTKNTDHRCTPKPKVSDFLRLHD